MGLIPDWAIHLRVEFGGVLAGSFQLRMFCSSVIFEKSWQSSKDPSEWKKGDITQIFSKGRKVDTREQQICDPHLCVWEYHGKDPHGRHMPDQEVIQDSQHSFSKHNCA